tara:strand:+ start:2968 stop:3759 length:792 start_codon:yes stop_codon:yes gene_type:complete
MNKNLIYMVAIDHHASKFKVSEYSKYSIPAWEFWCKKNDVDFMLITEHDERFDKPIWNKELVFENINDQYEKIGIVDADTMIKWDAPNIFEMYDDEFCGVVDNDSFYFMHNSINSYGKFFPDTDIDTDNYINAGVVFLTREHKHFFDAMLEFYFEHKDELDNWSIPNTGREQTIFNFMLEKLNIKKKYLPPSWNMFGMHKKGLFLHNWQLASDTDTDNAIPFFIKYGNIWHFTGFPIEDRIKLMGQVWDTFKGNYSNNIKNWR